MNLRVGGGRNGATTQHRSLPGIENGDSLPEYVILIPTKSQQLLAAENLEGDVCLAVFAALDVHHLAQVGAAPVSVDPELGVRGAHPAHRSTDL